MTLQDRLKLSGDIASPDDPRDYVLADMAVVTDREFRSPYLDEALTYVKDQGRINSCGAHTLAANFSGQQEQDISPSFVYGLRCDSEFSGELYKGPGTIPSQTLYNLRHHFYVDTDGFDYPALENPSVCAYVDARYAKLKPEYDQNQIAGYARIWSVAEIKQALMQNMLVYGSFSLDHRFVPDKNGFAQTCGASEASTRHAMAIFGWTVINGKSVWIVLNSWGKDWGLDGLCYTPMDVPLNEAWAITDVPHKVKPPEPKPGRPLIKLLSPLMRDKNGRTDIREMQTTLNRKGYRDRVGRLLTEDGVFGGNSDYTVRQFQRKNGLTVDGKVGPMTWSALGI